MCEVVSPIRHVASLQSCSANLMNIFASSSQSQVLKVKVFMKGVSEGWSGSQKNSLFKIVKRFKS